jgi:hypothetical protein
LKQLGLGRTWLWSPDVTKITGSSAVMNNG